MKTTFSGFGCLFSEKTIVLSSSGSISWKVPTDNIIKILLLFVTLFIIYSGKAQTCNDLQYTYNLSAAMADTSVTTISQSRFGQCCGAAHNSNCVTFFLTLRPGNKTISLAGSNITGADQIAVDCGTLYNASSICVNASATSVSLTNCKPGNNPEFFVLTILKQGNAGPDIYLRPGCTANLTASNTTSPNWTSIYPGAPGAYNSYLSCTSCMSPLVTQTGTPALPANGYIDYKLTSTNCLGSSITDTARVYFVSAPAVTISPSEIHVCSGTNDQPFTVIPSGGVPPYKYLWSNGATTASITPTAFGTYTVSVTDRAITCGSITATCTLTASQPIITNANSTTICSGSTLSFPLTSNAVSTYTWVADNNPNTTGESTSIQTTSTINDVLTNTSNTTQVVTYTVTASPTGGGCAGTTQLVSVTVIPSLIVTVSPDAPSLLFGNVTLTASVGGGLPDYSFKWKNSSNDLVGSNASYIATLPGTYIVEISDELNITACNTFKVVTVNMNPLPIELIYFNATFNGKSIDIEWETASEINNDYFTLERSVDMINFLPICLNIPSKAPGGNSTSILSYRLTDNNVLPGIYYYRLKQTDVNGKSNYSDIDVVEINGIADFTFEIAPNPCDGIEFSSIINAEKDKEIVIVLYDILGQEKYSKAIVTEQKGNTVYIIDLDQKLNAGVYLITATSDQKIYSKRLVVN